jgi:hypothetical protein
MNTNTNSQRTSYSFCVPSLNIYKARHPYVDVYKKRHCEDKNCSYIKSNAFVTWVPLFIFALAARIHITLSVYTRTIHLGVTYKFASHIHIKVRRFCLLYIIFLLKCFACLFTIACTVHIFPCICHFSILFSATLNVFGVASQLLACGLKRVKHQLTAGRRYKRGA